MIQALIAPVSALLNKFIPDADERAKLAHDIATMSQKHAQELAKGQLEINKEEAKHRSLFVAGWRPFLGWILAAAMGWHFVFAPMTMFICAYLSVAIPELPVFDMDSLMTVLLGMLGLGGLRTAEKIKGITK
tara:strand:- start:2343 stop:2738 length:396 start_codon:yes stop_codon:yes gene_type:complete